MLVLQVVDQETGKVLSLNTMTVRDGETAKAFKSGSVGYFVSGKATLPDSHGKLAEHQISASFVLIGSKPK